MNLYISTYMASYRLDLCERLSRDYGFAIFHYHGEEVPADVAPYLSEYTFENQRLPVKMLFGKPYAAALDALLSSLRPDVVFIQEFSLITLQLLRLRRKYGYRLISICDDSMDMIEGHDFGMTHRLARRLIPRALDNLVLNSPETMAWYRVRYGKGCLLPILSSEDKYRERLRRVLPDAVRFRKEAGAEGKRLILFVGRLVGLKNLPVLLQAADVLREEARLAIVGAGPLQEELQRQAKEDVFFAGPRYGKDLLACYQASDVVVLPSLQEAFGAVVGEALMAGCPVAVSVRAGSKSLVRPGKNGELFAPDAPGQLVTALRSIFAGFPLHQASLLRDSLCPVSFDSSFTLLAEQLDLPSRS